MLLTDIPVLTVIPVKADIQEAGFHWIPACAEMTSYTQRISETGLWYLVTELPVINILFSPGGRGLRGYDKKRTADCLSVLLIRH